MSSDRIEKKILLRAPRSRVWQALADKDAFGAWFGVRLSGSFAPGARVQGQILHKGYEHHKFEVTIETMEPERVLSWRWHPHSPEDDVLVQESTLVVFELKDAPEGTLLTVTESGFDKIPPAQRLPAFRGNEQGWEMQLRSIESYVQQQA